MLSLCCALDIKYVALLVLRFHAISPLLKSIHHYIQLGVYTDVLLCMA